MAGVITELGMPSLMSVYLHPYRMYCNTRLVHQQWCRAVSPINRSLRGAGLQAAISPLRIGAAAS